MDAATLYVLVARTLSSWGHGTCDSGCAGSTDVIPWATDVATLDVLVAPTLSSCMGPWVLRQWMCWQHGRYHPGAMDAATLH